MSNISRVISVFEKDGESLVEMINVDHLSFESLCKIFNPPADDKDYLYNVYPIESNEANQLEKLTNFKFDLDKYYYQLDCFQKENS